MEENLSVDSTRTSSELKATTQLLEHGRRELSKIIAGQTAFIDQTLVVAFCRGHALIEGVPGIAKTCWSNCWRSCWGSSSTACRRRRT